MLYLTLVLTVIAVLITGRECAAASRETHDEVSRLIKETPILQSYKDAGAVILLKDMKMKVEKDGIYTLTIHVVGKVLDDRAAQEYSQVVIPFNSYYEEASLLLGRTINEEGAIKIVSADAIQIKTTPGDRQYTDVRLLTFSLPALEKGSVFEFEIKKKQNKPIVDGRWSEELGFQYCHQGDSVRIDPVYRSRFTLEMPEKEPFAHSVNNIKIIPQVTKKSSLVIYQWDAAGLPNVPIEKAMPSLNDLMPSVRVSSIKTWDEVAQWADRHFSPSAEVTPDIRTKAQEITKGLINEREKIEAVFYFMETNVKYVAADLNRGGFKPHAASEVLKNKYGDCKDQTVLFVSLLKALGIEAYPALINSNPHDEIDTAVPAPNFDHAIVYIPLKEGHLWLDTTTGIAKFPRLSWQNQNKWSLVIDGRKGKLMKTTGSDPEENEAGLSIEATFNDSSAVIKTVVMADGAFGDWLRMVVKTLSYDEQKNYIGNFLKRAVSVDGHVGSIELADSANPRLIFKVPATVEVKDERIQSTPSYTISWGLRSMLGFFTDLDNLAEPEQRKQAYRQPFSGKLVQEWSCKPPRKGMKPDVLPENQSITTPFFTYDAVYTRDGDSVKAKQVLVFKEGLIDKARYREFYEGIQDVAKISTAGVTFVYRKESPESMELTKIGEKESGQCE